MHKKLMRYLGFENDDAPVMSLLQQFVEVDERIKKHFGSVFRPLWRRAPKNRPDEYLTDGTVKDEWGIVYRPAMGGTYYDVIEFPLRGLKTRDLNAYPWPDPKDTGEVLDKLLEFWVEYAEEHFRAVGEFVDVVCLGDDFGTESGPWMSEVGINALTPLQVSAKEMETDTLKREFGKDLTFWGGIDTQRVLPRGSTKDVEEEVKKRFRDPAPGGGYVLA